MLEFAAILDYAPALELVEEPRIRFCGNVVTRGGDVIERITRRHARVWGNLAYDFGLAPELLVAIGNWYLQHITGPSSDVYFSTIQRMILAFQRAYEENTHVNGYDGGLIQELAYGAEGGVEHILWFVYNACEFFDGLHINLDEDQMRGFARVACGQAILSTSTITRKAFCEYVQNRLLEHILPEICHFSIYRSNPRVYHRSTKKGITRFDPTKMRFGDYGPGFYFAEEHEGVSYAGHHLYTADVDIDNPLDVENAPPAEIDRLRRSMRIEKENILMDDPTPPAIQIFGLLQTLWDAGLGYRPQAVIKVLKALGYDGIVVPSKGYWVAFDPDQIMFV